MPTTCHVCGAGFLEVDNKCSRCGAAPRSGAALRRLGSDALGQYEVVEVIGQGGMSSVYRARHKLTAQQVALKILPAELAAQPVVRSRFLEEARALAQLDHPNIVHLYNFGEENGSFVLAMQHIRGETFERMIFLDGRLPWEIAARVGIDVCRALEYAHARGIIHRDMKPSNILVRQRDGAALVMDFGIAKTATSTRLTATGQTMGTVRYMSPEQVRGEKVDQRADLYSLGVTLYEAIVGETPFDGETHFEIMNKQLNESPQLPSARGISTPAAVEESLHRCLAKSPGDRLRSCADLRVILAEALAASGIGESEAARRGRAVIARIQKRLPPQQGPRLSTPRTAPPVTGKGPTLWRPTTLTWLVLAAVAAAAAGAALVLAAADRDKAIEPTRAPAARWPEPLPLPELVFAIDRRFAAEELRVMSVAERHPEVVRRWFATGFERFKDFVRRHGIDADIKRQPLTVQIVPEWVLCDARIYREGAHDATTAPPTCTQETTWYRPHEKTLYVADSADDKRLAVDVGFYVAGAVCVHSTPPIGECNRELLDSFERELAEYYLADSAAKTSRSPEGRGAE